MKFIHKLKLYLFPTKLNAPYFGDMLFMYISNNPESSYWECKWKFPVTGKVIEITLPGTEENPFPESRDFYIELIDKYDEILNSIHSMLTSVFRTWLSQDLPNDIFTVLKLSGFCVENPKDEKIE